MCTIQRMTFARVAHTYHPVGRLSERRVRQPGVDLVQKIARIRLRIEFHQQEVERNLSARHRAVRRLVERRHGRCVAVHLGEQDPVQYAYMNTRSTHARTYTRTHVNVL